MKEILNGVEANLSFKNIQNFQKNVNIYKEKMNEIMS